MAIFVYTCQPRKFLEGHEFVWCDAMRGLHFLRPPFTQSKLVRCVKGRVLDVAVDIRKGSPRHTVSMWL